MPHKIYVAASKGRKKKNIDPRIRDWSKSIEGGGPEQREGGS